MLTDLNEQKCRIRALPMIIYHHNDLDGECSAAIIGIYAKDKGYEPHYISCDYKDEVKVEDIPFGGNIAIVDFSFKPEIMEKVRKRASRIIWCDHHVTAKEYDYQDLPGLRDFTEKGKSGCECAWIFCYPSMPIPRSVQTIGDYDSWRLKTPELSFPFYEGLKLRDTHPERELWERLLGVNGFNGEKEFLAVLHDGQSAIMYRDRYCERLSNSYGYETQINNIQAYALNAYMFGSKMFADKMQKYPICIAYIHNGSRFTVSLYSETVDVSVICKNHGGGGHKGAAGFVCDELPFKARS